MSEIDFGTAHSHAGMQEMSRLTRDLLDFHSCSSNPMRDA